MALFVSAFNKWGIKWLLPWQNSAWLKRMPGYQSFISLHKNNFNFNLQPAFPPFRHWIGWIGIYHCTMLIHYKNETSSSDLTVRLIQSYGSTHVINKMHCQYFAFFPLFFFFFLKFLFSGLFCGVNSSANSHFTCNSWSKTNQPPELKILLKSNMIF